MSKKHSPKTSTNRGKRTGYKQTLTEALAIKPNNNEPCPCGATRTMEVFVEGSEEPKLVGVPIKYKKCCKGKAFFYKNEQDRKYAEADFNKRNPKKYNEILEEQRSKQVREKQKNE